MNNSVVELAKKQERPDRMKPFILNCQSMLEQMNPVQRQCFFAMLNVEKMDKQTQTELDNQINKIHEILTSKGFGSEQTVILSNSDCVVHCTDFCNPTNKPYLNPAHVRLQYDGQATSIKYPNLFEKLGTLTDGLEALVDSKENLNPQLKKIIIDLTARHIVDWTKEVTDKLLSRKQEGQLGEINANHLIATVSQNGFIKRDYSASTNPRYGENEFTKTYYDKFAHAYAKFKSLYLNEEQLIQMCEQEHKTWKFYSLHELDEFLNRTLTWYDFDKNPINYEKTPKEAWGFGEHPIFK